MELPLALDDAQDRQVLPRADLAAFDAPVVRHVELPPGRVVEIGVLAILDSPKWNRRSRSKLMVAWSPAAAVVGWQQAARSSVRQPSAEVRAEFMRQPFKLEQVQEVGMIVDYYYSPGGSSQPLWSAAIYCRFGFAAERLLYFWGSGRMSGRASRSFLPGGLYIAQSSLDSHRAGAG